MRVVVLDRPNPLGGLVVDGPVNKEKYTSFVGRRPLAMRHGMTIGELAMLFNAEYVPDATVRSLHPLSSLAARIPLPRPTQLLDSVARRGGPKRIFR